MSTTDDQDIFAGVTEDVGTAVERGLDAAAPALSVREVGRVVRVGPGVAIVSGLPGAQSEEVLRFRGGQLGMVFNLDREEIGAVLMDARSGIEAGDEVRRTHRVTDVPVGEAVIGRVLDPLGRPRDNGGELRPDARRPIEQPAPAVLDRDPVGTPLQTGLKVVDALVPIGRGQRELIVGDRQTGKTAIGIGAILHQRDTGVLCFYCAIGQRSSGISKVIADLRNRGAMEYTTVIATTGEDAPALRFAAPYAAMAMAEHFMGQGRDVLIVFDDLTRHARAYRELSLLLRRPPGREAFPGDVFYIHSRLLERSTHLRKDKGGGTITALPIVETQAQNISAYIPTNLISITDGQIYLSPTLFQQGQLPPVDVGRSVSRVGGKAQLKAFREVAGDLRLGYSQFQELERFSRYGARLEEAQRKRLEHGKRIRRILQQGEHDLMSAPEQVIVLLAAGEGLFDRVPEHRVGEAERELRRRIPERLQGVADRIGDNEKLTDEDKGRIRDAAKDVAKGMEP